MSAGAQYAIYLCDGGPHTPRVPHPDCGNAANHTPSPEGYVAESEWADEMTKTHRQVRCPDCGYWVIWVAKDQQPEAVTVRG